MIGILTLGAIALGLVGARKQQTGIGRVKRRIYRELADAQDHGIDFNSVYYGDESMLRSLANKYGYKGSKKSTKPIEEQYFNSLQRAYRAISGIGSTSLPYHKSEVTNKYGDVVLAYYDYGTEEDMWNAARDFWRNMGEFNGYNRTVQYLAEGGKFLWSGGGGKDAVKKGVKEECFASRGDVSGERKKRLSYLSKQGLTPAAFAERIWGEGYEMDINRSPDDMEIKDGVIQAILDIENAGQARQMIMDFYLESHTDPEEPMHDREEADPFPVFLGVRGVGYAAASEPWYCGIPKIKYVWHGEWADPEIYYRGKYYNSVDVEDWFYPAYKEDPMGLTFEEWMRNNESEVKYVLQHELQPVYGIGELEDLSDRKMQELMEYVYDRLRSEYITGSDISKAWGKMDRKRCPLEQASTEIYSAIESAIDDFMYDNDFDDMWVDPEEVFEEIESDRL